MKKAQIRFVVAGTLAGAAALAASPNGLTAQDAFTWENSTELSFVSTGGNASSSSLGLKATLAGTGAPNSFKFEAGGIRSETSTTTRTATGTLTSYTIAEATVSQVTAENYFLRGRFDRSFDGAYGYTGAGWERNTFAGVQNRYSIVAGLGRTFVDGDAGSFKADVGGTYTVQKDVDPVPGADEGFFGARLTAEAKRPINPSTDYESALVVDNSFENSDDLRADWINSLTIALSERLAFKTSLQLLFDNEPSQLSVPLFDTAGTPTGSNVLTPGEKIDSILTLTLVIKL